MVATQLTEMLEWNIIAPFKFVKVSEVLCEVLKPKVSEGYCVRY